MRPCALCAASMAVSYLWDVDVIYKQEVLFSARRRGEARYLLRQLSATV